MLVKQLKMKYKNKKVDFNMLFGTFSILLRNMLAGKVDIAANKETI